MTPRPRKASDEEIFAATQRVMMRLGPAQWTLADIASESGLTAGALVQRFGSKRNLMVALTEAWARSAPHMIEQLRAQHDSPLETLRAYGDCIAMMGETPAAFAHHLSYLQIDLTDPDLHKHVRAQAKTTHASIRRLLYEAVVRGELVQESDAEQLARMIAVTLNGSLMTWAFYQDGTAQQWLREDLDNVLRPFVASKPRKQTRTGGKHVARIRKRR